MAEDPRVLIVTMPWQSVTVPSIQLGILKSSLLQAGVPTDCLYANLSFADAVGFEEYSELATGDWYPFLCEWLFNGFIDGSSAIEDATLIGLMDVLANNPITRHARLKDRHGAVLNPADVAQQERALNGAKLSTAEYFQKIKFEIIPQVFEDLFSRVDFDSYTLIAFTCAFSQVVPSLAFAREIKKRFPNCRIALGGSAVHGEIGDSVRKFFPVVDYVCDGDGEEAIVAMARGSFTNGTTHQGFALEQSPLPHYGDYFAQVRELESKHMHQIQIHDGSIPYETSRGCILAVRRPCAFCALNGSHPSLTRKSIDKTLSDIDELTSTYSPTGIAITDNLVNVRDQRRLFEELRNRGAPAQIFLETTPNLSWRELTLAKEAGVVGIQAGVEALSTPLLKLLGKRNSLDQTLRFLEDCTELGIAAHYNLLIGIPGESSEHYQAVLDLIPLITHIRPPAIPLTPISLQRHSPYWSNPSKYGIEHVRPAHQYSYIFPQHMIDEIAFFFDFDVSLPTGFDAGYMNELVDAVLAWHRAYYGEESGQVLHPIR